MDEAWTRAKGVFAALAGPPVVWLAVFFLIPLGVIWGYSFGENASLTHIAVNGTFANYAHAIRPLYLGIIVKSLWFAGLTTVLCLLIGFPVAIAITFASQKTKAWLLLLIMLPFWTNLLIRTYALMAVLRTEGYVNQTLGFLWRAPAGSRLYLASRSDRSRLWNSCTTISPWFLDWSMSSCRSWSCRSTPPWIGWIDPFLRRVST